MKLGAVFESLNKALEDKDLDNRVLQIKLDDAKAEIERLTQLVADLQHELDMTR